MKKPSDAESLANAIQARDQAELNGQTHIVRMWDAIIAKIKARGKPGRPKK